MVKRGTLIATAATDKHEGTTQTELRKCHPILNVADMLLTRADSQLCHKVKYYISSVHAIFSRAKYKITRSKQI